MSLCKFGGFNKNTSYELITVHTTQSIRAWPDGGHRILSYSYSLKESWIEKSYSHLKNIIMNRTGKNQIIQKQNKKKYTTHAIYPLKCLKVCIPHRLEQQFSTRGSFAPRGHVVWEGAIGIYWRPETLPNTLQYTGQSHNKELPSLRCQ